MWVKLDDHFGSHPKIVALTDASFRLHVEALSYCGLHESEGWVPSQFTRGKPKQLAQLLQSGLWSKDGDGFQIHDWADWNGTREQRTARRAANADRQRRWRETRDM